MAANIVLDRLEESGWRRGFANVLRKENHDWWGTRRWWINFIIWFLLLNSAVFIPLFLQSTEIPNGMNLTAEERARWMERITPENRAAAATRTFVDLAGTASILGVVILMQNVLIDEKRSGTAAWILSKPVSRTALLVAKLVANGLALFVIAEVAQWVLVYLQLSIFSGAPLPVGNFVLGVGIVGLTMLFFLTLTLMLGALFDNRGAVLAIPLVGLFVVMFLSSNIPALLDFTPLPLVFGTLGNPQNGVINSLAMQAVTGEPISRITPILVTLLWSAIFFAVAVWRFRREEF